MKPIVIIGHAAIAAALVAITTLTPQAWAKPKTALQQSAAANANVTVFATGLTSPRHIRFGPDGLLYVAEAGTGGSQLANTPGCPPADNFFTTPPLHPYQAGFSGRISRISRNGTRATVVTGLPSSRDGFDDSYGPSDIAWIGRTMYVLLQGGGCSRGLPNDPAGIVRINRDGSYTFLADISAFIRANPPTVEPACGPTGDCEPDGVPHTLIAQGHWFYVVEANHNSILRVNGKTGAITRIYDLSVQDPAPITLLRKGNDFYLGAFDGLIQTFNHRFGPVSTLDQGYGGIVDLAMVHNRLYVLQTSSAETPFAPNNGSVIRRNKDGSRTVIASELNFPVGMVRSHQGNVLFVSTVGYGQGTQEGLGQIVRIDLK